MTPESMRYLLKIRQALPLELKIKYSLRRIRLWYEHFDGQVYIAFSGGKDSRVLADLVWSIYPDVPAVFADTGNELESVREYVKGFGDRIIWVRPKMTFDEVVAKYGYPVINKEQAQRISQMRSTKSEKLRDIRWNGYPPKKKGGMRSGKIAEKWKFVVDAPFNVTNKCCKYLKCAPCSEYEKTTGRLPHVGSMADESRLREQSIIKFGCNAFGAVNNKASRPLAFWTEQDILLYLQVNCIGIASAYGEIVGSCRAELRTTGESRTGCKYCLFGAHKDKENRIQRLARVEPEAYRHAIEDLHYDEVMDYLGIEWRPVEEVERRKRRADPQMDMFDGTNGEG